VESPAVLARPPSSDNKGGPISKTHLPLPLGPVLLAAAVSFAACHRSEAPPGPIAITDDAGARVSLAVPARRVVSLIPATTELLFAIGAGSQLVGRTAWCNYPAAAALVPNLGDGLNPNLEAVLGAEPDLVVLYHSGQNAAPADRLRAAGVAVALFDTDLLSEVATVANRLGRLTGHVAEADSLIESFRHQLEAATVATPPADPTTVFMLVWDQPPITIGGGSFLTELVARAGGANIFADIEAPSAPVSIEAVAARNPDVILVLGEGTPAFLDRPEWQTVPAVRERRVMHVAGSEFNRPSPRAPDAIRELRRVMAEVSP